MIRAYNVNNFYGQANITGMNPKANYGVSYPPLRGIVQLTNSDALHFRNWSFTINCHRAKFT
jgi:hypothetical protein